jgi:hypothetical protein
MSRRKSKHPKKLAIQTPTSRTAAASKAFSGDDGYDLETVVAIVEQARSSYITRDTPPIGPH